MSLTNWCSRMGSDIKACHHNSCLYSAAGCVGLPGRNKDKNKENEQANGILRRVKIRAKECAVGRAQQTDLRRHLQNKDLNMLESFSGCSKTHTHMFYHTGA